MSHPLEAGTIRIVKSDGSTAGTGFFVSERLVVTCAHVVASVGEIIQMQFKGSNTLYGRVISDYYRNPDKGDVAFLHLESIPYNITPLRLGAAEHSLSGSPFQSFGYPDLGDIKGIHVRGEIRRMTLENDQHILQLDSKELNLGHSGAPIWDEKRGVVVGMVVSVYKSDASGKLRDTAFAIPSETLWEVCRDIYPSETAPYIGLETFTDQSSQFFFGREDLTKKLLNILRSGNRFLALFGPSGSGKSSVIKAGLFPALKSGQLPRSQKWAQLQMRPASNPFEQLKASGFDTIDINDFLRTNREFDRIILFIDQFEELFTLCPDELHKRFTRDLAVALENPKFILVLSMRDDFYSAFNAKAALLATSEHLEIENAPGTLRRDEIVLIIEQPAQKVGLLLEEGLSELIIKDLMRDGESVRSSILPLLEFTLLQLWERRQDGYLTHEAYQTIGGVTGSLARWADDAYSELSNGDQAMAERILTSLVHLGDDSRGLPDTRRWRKMSDMSTSEAKQKVIKHFVDRRLLVVSDGIVELVHDALVIEWRKLRRWLDDDRQFLIWKEKISEKYHEWKNGKGDLLGGRYLSEAKGYLRERQSELEDLKVFITSSVKRQLVYRFLSILSFFIVIIIAFWGSNNAAEANSQKAISSARWLVLQAQSIHSNPMLETLLAIQSMKFSPSSDAHEIIGNSPLSLTLFQLSHDDTVTISSISPNGKYVVTGSADRTLRVWNAVTGKELYRKTFLSYAVDISPDSKYFALGNSDGTIHVLEIISGREIALMTHESNGYFDGVRELVFSPDGKFVVSGGYDNTARVWEVATGQEVARVRHKDDHNGVHELAFSPNGRYVVSGNGEETLIWEMGSETIIGRFFDYGGYISDAEFSRNGKYVAIGGSDGIARVLDITIGKESAFIGGEAVAFSPDSKYLVTGSYDGAARVWEIASSRIIAIKDHEGSVNRVAFSPDGQNIGSSSNGVIFVWDIISGQIVARKDFENSVRFFTFSPDGEFIISNKGKSVWIWSTSIDHEFSRIEDNSKISEIVLSPDGRYLISRNYTVGVIRVWETMTGKEISHMSHDNVIDIVVSSDGRYIVSGGRDKFIRLWDLLAGKEVATFFHENEINRVAISPDQNFVASSTEGDNAVHVWDIATGQEIAYITHEDLVSDIEFSPDEKFIASSSFDNTVQVWGVVDGVVIAHLSHENKGIADINSVSFSPDGIYIVTGGSDNTARVWKVNSGKEVALKSHEDDVTSVKFSSDGKYVISKDKSGFTRIWTWRSMLERDANVISGGGKISPDEKYIAKVVDNTVHIWELNGTTKIASIKHNEGLSFIEFSQDGRYLITVTSDNVIHVWLYRPDDLISHSCSLVTRNLTREEWVFYIGNEVPYQSTCPNFPADDERHINADGIDVFLILFFFVSIYFFIAVYFIIQFVLLFPLLIFVYLRNIRLRKKQLSTFK